MGERRRRRERPPAAMRQWRCAMIVLGHLGDG